MHNVRLRFCPIIRDGSAEDQFGPGFKSESDNCANIADKKDNNNNLNIIKNKKTITDNAHMFILLSIPPKARECFVVRSL